MTDTQNESPKPAKKRGNPGSQKNNGKNAHDKIMKRQREVQAIQLRRAGATFDQIAEQIGTTATNAYRIVQRYLDRVSNQFMPVARDVLTMELERCDELLVRHNAELSVLQEGDTEGLQRITNGILKILDRRARYLGLNKDNPLVNVSVDNRKTTNNVDITIGEKQVREVVLPILKGATTDELKELREKLQGIKVRNDAQIITQAGRLTIEPRIQPEAEFSDVSRPVDNAGSA